MDGPHSCQTESGASEKGPVIFSIIHQIDYAYSTTVFLEPHMLLLRPRSEACQQVGNYSLTVKPRPAGIHDFLDPEGNCATCLWFEGKTSFLSITASFEVQTFCPNPFNYLVTDKDFLQLPAVYPENDATALAPFLGAQETDAAVIAFGASIRHKSGDNTLDFLSRLCSVIYEDFTVEIRDHGSARPAAITLQNGCGACRDLAVLYMAVCRSVGLAARFVSGYQEGDPDMDQRHLHAWPEVYVPGGGWRGYDPTHGLGVADRHIALAASHSADRSLPVRGSFRKTGATAAMSYHISLAARG